MAKLHAVWVHGVSVRPQEQGYFTSMRYCGNSAQFLSHGAQWFHFSIPTPVIVDDLSSRLVKVFLLYNTAPSARITFVHLHDGASLLTGEVHEGLNLKGDHSLKLDSSNTWAVPSKPHIHFGLALSFMVSFGDPVPLAVPSIEFVAAGADFEVG